MTEQQTDAVVPRPPTGTPPISETAEQPVPRDTDAPAPGGHTAFRLTDGSEVTATFAEEGEIIPARKVRQALQAIVPKDPNAAADQQTCLRRQWLMVQLSSALNGCAKLFPPAAERDLNNDLNYAACTLQRVMKWR